MDKRSQRPRGAPRDDTESNANKAPARVHWKRAELLAAKQREQLVVDELGGFDRPLTAAERDRLVRALRNIRHITKVQRAWRGGRL